VNKRSNGIKRLGEKVRYLRKRTGMSQAALAGELGYTSRGYISELEKGRHLPTAETIVRLAIRFKVTTDYLLRDEIDLEDVRDFVTNNI
jgi:transcriptional regulator with XRE-family HTH domain